MIQVAHVRKRQIFCEQEFFAGQRDQNSFTEMKELRFKYPWKLFTIQNLFQIPPTQILQWWIAFQDVESKAVKLGIPFSQFFLES